MSLLVRWRDSAAAPLLLPLIAAVAVCDVAGEDARIKWPNDIVIERGAAGPALAKLAGILIEGRPQERWAVVGIGLNVAVRLEELPAELRPGRAGSAAARVAMPAATLGRAPGAVEPTLAQLLAALERRFAQPPETTLEAWRERDALRGREITWGAQGGSRPGRGRVEGVDGLGRLIVALPEGGHTTLSAGELHLAAID
jgi:BirA family biotin operon repressor/biotin-[acetyl-CoA-carboxylase] ligase